MKISFEYNPEDNSINILSMDGINEKVCIDININPSNGVNIYKQPKQRNNENSLTKIVVEDKIVSLPQDLINKLGLIPGEDRVSITYTTIDDVYVPIICNTNRCGTDSGNKLTKRLTFSFKGKQRDRLLIFGTEFDYSEYKPGLYKLISTGKVQNDDSVFKEKDTDLDIVITSKQDMNALTDLLLSNSPSDDLDLLANTEVVKSYTQVLSTNKQENLSLEDIDLSIDSIADPFNLDDISLN